MIEYKDGDLLTEPNLDAICHQANCFSKMKSGIAGAIVGKWPIVAAIDSGWNVPPEKKLGDYTMAMVENDDGNLMALYNLYGQFMYGTDSRKTDYDALRNAMEKMLRRYNLFSRPIRIGIPYKIGCGLAGGDWELVKDIIESVFGHHKNITAVIVKKS